MPDWVEHIRPVDSEDKQRAPVLVRDCCARRPLVLERQFAKHPSRLCHNVRFARFGLDRHTSIEKDVDELQNFPCLANDLSRTVELFSKRQPQVLLFQDRQDVEEFCLCEKLGVPCVPFRPWLRRRKMLRVSPVIEDKDLHVCFFRFFHTFILPKVTNG